MTIDHTATRRDGDRLLLDLAVTATRRGGDAIDAQPASSWQLVGDRTDTPGAGEVLAAEPTLSTWCSGSGELAVTLVIGTASSYDAVLPAMRTELRGLLDRLREQCHEPQLGVIAVGAAGDATLVRGADAAATALDELRADAGPAVPDLLGAIELAVSDLAQSQPRRPGAALRRAVVVVADGRNRDLNPDRYAQVGRDAARRSIRIDPIGYHADGDRRFLLTLAELAHQSLGTFRWLPEARFNPRLFERAVAALEHELIHQPVLTFKLDPRVGAGRPVRLRLTVGDDHVESRNAVALGLPATRPQPRHAFPVAAAVALALGLGAIGAGTIAWRRRRGSRHVPTSAMPASAMPAVAHPASAAPLRPAVSPALGPALDPGPMLRVTDRTGLRRIAARDGLRIGRDPTCELVLDDPSVSAIHAELRSVDGVLTIVDRSSTGLFVNQVRVPAAPLRPGMQITVGSTVLHYEAGTSGAPR